MNKKAGFILKIVKEIEDKFNCIAYAYFDEKGGWWCICVDNYELYMKDDVFRKAVKIYHIISSKKKVKITFSYCKPLESKLKELAKNDNLILNI